MFIVFMMSVCQLTTALGSGNILITNYVIWIIDLVCIIIMSPTCFQIEC